MGIELINKQPNEPQFPTKEEAHEIVKDLLRTSGVINTDSCEILDEPFNIVAPSELEGYAKQVPCYVAIAKSTGLVLLFVCTGPYGIFERFRRKQKQKQNGNGELDHLG